MLPFGAPIVILRYSEGSGPCVGLRRSFGVPHDGICTDNGYLTLNKRVSKLTFAPREHDLPRLSRQHRVEAFLKILKAISMRNHRIELQAGLEHDGHFVPRLIHFAAVDALDGEHVEDDGV